MLSILLPTRGRPDNVRRLLASVAATATGDVEVVAYVDDDDPARAATVAALDEHGAITIVGPRVVLSETWNRCWERATSDVAMHCGDDIVFRTPDWDARVLAEFERVPDRIVFVHGDDGIQNGQIGTHGFLHRNWVDVVGYFVPPYFSSDFNDLWLTDVANALGRRVYLSDVYTEHMHPVAGKAELDQTHRERLDRHVRDGVEQRYRDLAPERARDVERLRAFITVYGL